MRASFATCLLAAALCAAGATRASGETDTDLRFLRHANPVRTLTLPQLIEACPPKRIELEDPYYGRKKSYLACPLQKVLELGFGKPMSELVGLDFFFRASDGYLKPAPGARLAQPGGWVAYADAEFTPEAEAATPFWEPIDRRQVNPGPYYVVWTGPEQNDPHRWPWPYALTSIEIIEFDVVFPHLAPAGAVAGSAAWKGFEIFRNECIACHSINGEGGKVGPDLNLPRSIVEYRPRDQIMAFIRDPATFRYTTMPANKHLSDKDLAALVDYFEAMATLKHDPGAAR